MIERRAIPTLSRMTIRAVCHCECSSGRRVHGRCSLLPRSQVAARVAAVRGRNLQAVVVIDVALRAGNICVPVRQRKSCGVVIKLHLQPSIRRVAQVTSGGETCGDVVWVRSFLEVLQVTRGTSCVEALILAHSRALVALLARHSGVCPKERKAILVILNLLCADLPPQYRVALCAVRAHLAAMDIGVAVLTIFADVRKHGFDMTLCALHFFVHAAKRIPRFIVIKLRNRTNRAPSCGGVAILARYV